LSSSHAEPSSTRIEYIDAWRFIAVVLVILSHLLLFSGINLPHTEEVSLQIDRMGEMGVLIFFVISGFVICSGLISEREKSGTVCLSAFCVRRFFRIIPALWFYLIVISLLSFFGILETTRQQALTSFLFLCNMPFPAGCSWYAGHTWSLAYEEQFYLLFPLLFIFIPTLNSSKKFAWLIAAITLGSVVFRYFNQLFLAEYLGYFLFLFTGCWAAFAKPVLMPKLRKMSVTTWILFLMLLLICLNFLPLTTEKYIKTICYPGLITILVLGTPTQNKLISLIFKNKHTCYLGRVSYSVYLWQEPVTGNYMGWLTAAQLLAVFMFGLLSFKYFELPLQKLGSDLSKRLKISSQNTTPKP
jgi:peptidoglycan/LPS O-acetylase OafA/YrhL